METAVLGGLRGLSSWTGNMQRLSQTQNFPITCDGQGWTGQRPVHLFPGIDIAPPTNEALRSCPLGHGLASFLPGSGPSAETPLGALLSPLRSLG